jgi:uncharacterized protein YgbK (DUF1537 family)
VDEPVATRADDRTGQQRVAFAFEDNMVAHVVFVSEDVQKGDQFREAARCG